MAILFPDMETVKAAKQKPTEGELFLLEFLVANFGDEAEVYFQPCFNGDRPDIVVMSPKGGVIIIEVKDWNLDLYSVDSNNKWSVRTESRSQAVKSPFAQVFSYKKNFFDIHVNGLLEKSLKNDAFFKVINTYAYFHRGSKNAVGALYQPHIDHYRELSLENQRELKAEEKSFDAYEKTHERIERSKHKFERDKSLSIYQGRLHKIKFPIEDGKDLFDESVYGEFKRLLNPPYHYAKEGKPIVYSERQKALIQSAAKARVKVCGLAGSGKTVVLAGRAVSAHKRHRGEVLVLTFNITLGSYIRDKISAVREDFSWRAFQISNYHRFITGALNNAEIAIDIPENLNYEGEDPVVAKRVAIERNRYLESEYYGNVGIFDGVDVETRYSTILIDEVQDYKPEWIKIIRSNFLEQDGEMLLFGDEKQNIYERALDEDRRSKVVEGFGRWIKLTKSFRYAAESPIIPLVGAFQKSYLLKNYELDEDESFQLSLASVGVQAYDTFDKGNMGRLAEAIIGVAKKGGIHPNDISIISSQEGILRDLDFVLRTSESHKERTLCSFPSREVTKHPKYSRNYDRISGAKKIGFNLNSGVMKLSSTHSFKGFESPLIVLLINNNDSPEMVFTGLTRAKENLMVFLEADSPYLGFFSSHLNKLG